MLANRLVTLVAALPIAFSALVGVGSTPATADSIGAYLGTRNQITNQACTGTWYRLGGTYHTDANTNKWNGPWRPAYGTAVNFDRRLYYVRDAVGVYRRNERCSYGRVVIARTPEKYLHQYLIKAQQCRHASCTAAITIRTTDWNWGTYSRTGSGTHPW